MVTKMVEKTDIEKMGFRVMAVTNHPEGMSYDAHKIVGRRRLIQGDIMPTYHLALAALYMRCAEWR
jgi:hypothetical protein